MPNRRLTKEELELFAPLLENVRARLRKLAQDDEALHWALRRKLWNALQYDERLKPPYRAALKRKKRKEQNHRCALCSQQLPPKYAVLDRLEAMGGYTVANTRLLCPACDAKVQEERRYR